MLQFPAYRKYNNNQSFFRIDSDEELEELKIMGRHYQVYHIKAKIHPERVFINDLLYHSAAYCEIISSTEYDEKLAWCKENLKLI